MSTSSRRPRRKFTPEFKAEAVAMVEASGGQIAKVASELKLHDSSLGNWVREAREQAAGAPTAAERAEIRELRRRAGAGHPGAGHPGKSSRLLLGVAPEERVTIVYTFIAEEKANPDCAWSVAEMCRVLGVSRSGFYDWESRPPSDRELTDRQLAVEIEAIWECSAPHLRGAAGARLAGSARGSTRPASGSPGSCGATAGRASPGGAGCAPRSSTGRPRPATDRVGRDFNPTAPERHLVRRHHLPAHRGGLAVPGHRDRPVLPAGDRLVARRAHAHQPRRRRPADGGGHPRRRTSTG